MPASVCKLVLMPGLEGTGELFAGLVRALPEGFETTVVRYPRDVFLSYEQLLDIVRSSVPASERFVIVAESFSTPLAIQYAATNPPNLMGVVLSAGFASSPASGLLRVGCSVFGPIAFRIAMPDFVLRLVQVGPTGPSSLLAAMRSAVRSVQPRVMSARLREVLACDRRKELAQIAVPILYIQAERDRVVGAACLRDMSKVRPDMAVARIAGPHLILQREPERAAAIIAEFVGRLG